MLNIVAFEDTGVCGLTPDLTNTEIVCVPPEGYENTLITEYAICAVLEDSEGNDSQYCVVCSLENEE